MEDEDEEKSSLLRNGELECFGIFDFLIVCVRVCVCVRNGKVRGAQKGSKGE